MLSRLLRKTIERVAYSSVATVEMESLTMIAEILAVSQRNNHRDRVTGALVYSDGRFFQVLEGTSADIDRVLARIASDPRHREINIISRTEVEGRLFPDWSMCTPRVSPKMAPLLNKAIRASQIAPLGAIELVRILIADDRNRLEGEPSAQGGETDSTDQPNQDQTIQRA